MTRKQAWNEETIYALKLYETFLGLIGVWPFDVEKLSSKLRWFLAILIQMSTIISLSLEVYLHCVDLDDTMDAFLMDLSSVVSISKLLLTRINCQYTLSLVSSIVKDLSFLEDSDQREIVMKTLPLHYILPFNSNINESSNTKSTIYFLSTYCVFEDQSGLWRTGILILQAMQIFVNATSHCGNDGFFFGIAMYLCGQFEVLKMNFANLKCKNNRSNQKFDTLVRRHCHLIRLADNLEEAFNMIILIQLLMSALLLCVEGFQMLVSLDENDTIAAAKHAVLIVTLLVQLFIYSYAGDMLESKTAEIVLGVYDSSWYTFDTSSIKNLAFVMFYGRIPRQVTAGKFVSMNLLTFKEIIKASASYFSVLRVALKMNNINDVVWTTEANYALGTYKYITWTTGTWPLKKEGLFTMIRFGIAFALEFGILVSVLMEIRLNCGTADETLDFFALTAVTIAGLTKLILVKVHREDLQRILLSALKDWNTLVDSSLEKKILWKYTYRGKLLCRIQMGFGLVIITAMTLDALLAAISFQPVNENSTEEIFRQTPLRTMCIFGDMTTSTYWTVFVFQAVQMINAIAVDMGNDVFFFGIAMHICSQLHALKVFFDQFKSEESKDRIKKIDDFVNRHSHVLDLAQRLEYTYNNVLLAVLMADGLHICLAGIHILLLSKQYDMVQLLKTTVAFLVVLAQLFLYSYTGEYLSTLSQDICNVIYQFPWYECSPSTIKNVTFIIMRAHEPLRLTAGKFYTMNLENFKNILKASFSYFSVLRIMFDE
ncbi:PREDICTED: uncharacterized protein LOC106787618 [Polistes canadensis]|uniref:uncharacterized protein LOC106787618 n=1 Tax=Polistes canadensis TaxID=91411 RepID=UPI000718D99D|nr:PREDICTED: uncharacterized protein LOC106787618 [Polistes canadensis]